AKWFPRTAENELLSGGRCVTTQVDRRALADRSCFLHLSSPFVVCLDIAGSQADICVDEGTTEVQFFACRGYDDGRTSRVDRAVESAETLDDLGSRGVHRIRFDENSRGTSEIAHLAVQSSQLHQKIRVRREPTSSLQGSQRMGSIGQVQISTSQLKIEI